MGGWGVIHKTAIVSSSHLLATTMASSNVGQKVGDIDTLTATVPMGTADTDEFNSQRTEPAAARLLKDGRRYSDMGKTESCKFARQANDALEDGSVVAGSEPPLVASGASPLKNASQDSATERSAVSAGQRLSTN